MYELTVTGHFDSAHHIADYNGKCSRIHGHRWTVTCVVSGETLDHRNMLVDFVDVKKALNGILDQYDHFDLNEVLDERNVTAELLAKKIFDHLSQRFMTKEVTVWESPDCSVRYYESTE